MGNNAWRAASKAAQSALSGKDGTVTASPWAKPANAASTSFSVVMTIVSGVEYIAKNLSRSIGAPQIADAIGVRRSVLDALFRECLGRSVGEEVRRQRFARTKLLLSTTCMPVAEIASSSGYCTPSHLTNTFREMTGMSPSDWRKRLKADHI